MALAITHTKVLAIADDAADATAGKVVSSDWNAALTTSMATGKVLGRSTAGTGAIEELPTTGSGNVVLATAPTIAGGAHTGLTSFGLRSTGASFDLTLATAEVLTAGRTLSFVVGDTARTLALSGSPSLSGLTTTGTGTLALGSNTLTASNNVALASDGTGTRTLNIAAGGTLGSNAFNSTAFGTGTVTSVATTSPISGGTITGTGTLSLLVNVDHAFTAAQSVTVTGVGTAATAGLSLINTTAATVGAQQYGPMFIQTGQGWKTTATAASQTVQWAQQVVPVQGSTNPTANLVLSSQINGAGYLPGLTVVSQTTGGNRRVHIGTTSALYIEDQNGAGLVTGVSSGTQLTYLSVGPPVEFLITTAGRIGWSASTNVPAGGDTWLTRPAAATIQQGAANAASPVAQTLQAQGSRSGTDSNVGGANYTISGGLGTGTGTPSTLALASPIAVASGTGAQTMTTGLAIKAGAAVLTNYAVASLPAAATVGAGGTAFVTDASTTLILGLGGTVAGGGANKVPVYSDGTNWLYG